MRQRSIPCAFPLVLFVVSSIYVTTNLFVDWQLYLCAQVVKLYERCLIACARYPEYWIRYVLCMEASGSMELAENALARATQVFVKV